MFLEMMQKHIIQSCVAKVAVVVIKKQSPPNRVSSEDDQEDRLFKGTKPKKKKGWLTGPWLTK